MPTALEAATGAGGGGLAADLAAGVNTISQNQTITFVRYQRMTLPLDGLVFWVRSTLLISTPAVTSLSTPVGTQYEVTVPGSLHYAANSQQTEEANYSITSVVFTSLVEVEVLSTISPANMYIGTFEGNRFAFSGRGRFYRQSGLFHYSGDAVYSFMDTQIIDTLAQLADRTLVASNSLPVWLTLNQTCPMFPSFMVPENLPPPYCAVHIEPTETRALQAVPYRDGDGSHWQLASDRVRLTFFGVNNAKALAFQDAVLQYSLNTDVIGLMNEPIFRDDKMTQVELGTVAQRKTIEFEVSYYQLNVVNAAQQFIKSAFVEDTFAGWLNPQTNAGYTTETESGQVIYR
jgi:hypothetical protein